MNLQLLRIPEIEGDFVSDFLKAVKYNLGSAPDGISFDDIVRFGKNNNCWCVLHENGFGSYSDWSEDQLFHYSPKFKTEPTAEQRKAIREIREQNARKEEEKKAELQRQIAEQCQQKWETLQEASSDHPYLKKKGVGSYGLRQSGDKLFMPLYDNGVLVSFQTIRVLSNRETEKKFQSGGKVKGTCFIIGSGDPVYMAEGYATGASIYEATGKTVVVAVSAGNLINVAEKYPHAVIVADNDKSQTGEKKALDASSAHGNQIILIPEIGMDANDYATKYGKEKLKELLETAEPQKCEGKELFADGVDGLDGDISSLEWIVENWLPDTTELVSFFGASGSGKSAVVQDMMFHSITGQPWHGLQVKQVNWCYLMGEGSRGFKMRKRAWALTHGGIDYLKADFHEHLIATRYSFALDDPEPFSHLIEQIEAKKINPDVICIDTLNRFMEGDENSTRDASQFIKALDDLKLRYSCLVIYIHHTGQGAETQKRQRGSSVFKGALDWEFLVSKTDKKSPVKLEMVKVKDGEFASDVWLEFRSVPLGVFDKNGNEMRSFILKPIEEPEITKSDRQINDENMFFNAIEKYGQFRSDDSLFISYEHLKSYLTGKLTNQKGATIQKIATELNPRQNRYIYRLIKYGYVESVQRNSEATPDGWILIDREALDILVPKLRSQGELITG